MLQKMYETPGLVKCTSRVVPASYSPRSNRLPSNKEKTLWKKGSRLGNSTTDPTGTTRTCGSKLLLCCVRRRDCFEDGEAGTPLSIGVSQTTTFSACGESVLCSRSAIAILAESVTPWAPARTHKKR